LKSITNTTEDAELRKITGVSISVTWTVAFIEDRMRKVIVDEHCIMCSIKPELGSQVCIDNHSANLVHDREVEFLIQFI
jgi:hypothetical protein